MMRASSTATRVTRKVGVGVTVGLDTFIATCGGGWVRSVVVAATGGGVMLFGGSDVPMPSLFGSGSTVDAGRRPATRSTAANLMGSLSMGGVGTDVTATDGCEDGGGLVEGVPGWLASIKVGGSTLAGSGLLLVIVAVPLSPLSSLQ